MVTRTVAAGAAGAAVVDAADRVKNSRPDPIIMAIARTVVEPRAGRFSVRLSPGHIVFFNLPVARLPLITLAVSRSASRPLSPPIDIFSGRSLLTAHLTPGHCRRSRAPSPSPLPARQPTIKNSRRLLYYRRRAEYLFSFSKPHAPKRIFPKGKNPLNIGRPLSTKQSTAPRRLSMSLMCFDSLQTLWR